MDNSIRKDVVRDTLKFRRLYSSEYQKAGTLTAEIEQVIMTKSFYPSKRTETNLNGGLFTAEEFGFTEQEFDSKETRIAWINVPEGTPEAMVIERLTKAEAGGACIYRVLDNAPILSDDQKYAISVGLRTLDQFAAAQALRYPDNAETNPGGLILDNAGNIQYRKTFFWPTPQADIDNRGKGEIYASPELLAELKGAGVMKGQTV